MSRTDHHGDKKKAKLKPKWFWLQTTPGWWIRLMMTRPQRRKASVWQRNAEKTSIKDIDEITDPPNGRKPHHYFW